MGKDNFEVKAGRGSKMEGINLIILEHWHKIWSDIHKPSYDQYLCRGYIIAKIKLSFKLTLWT